MRACLLGPIRDRLEASEGEEEEGKPRVPGILTCREENEENEENEERSTKPQSISSSPPINPYPNHQPRLSLRSRLAITTTHGGPQLSSSSTEEAEANKLSLNPEAFPCKPRTDDVGGET